MRTEILVLVLFVICLIIAFTGLVFYIISKVEMDRDKEKSLKYYNIAKCFFILSGAFFIALGGYYFHLYK